LVVLSEQAQTLSQAEVNHGLEKTLAKVNKQVKSHEVLNGLFVVKDEWLPENGLMTPTLKVKRNEVAAYYQSLVEEHAEAKAVIWE